ncbi:MAG: hydrogenase maturation nickel metallochaperone HypA [Methylocystaceae bacterium]
MHELALVENILDTVRISAITNEIKQVGRIKLVIGKLSMALPDNLEFAFSCLQQQDQLFAEAYLDIEERNVVVRCSTCDVEFPIEQNEAYQCPHCQQNNITLISGRELYIDYFEGNDT